MVSNDSFRAASLKKILSDAGNDATNLQFLEVGSWKGDFSEELLKVFSPSRITLVDPWKVSTKNNIGWYGSDKINQDKMDEIYNQVQNRFASCDNVLIFRGAIDDFYAANKNVEMDVIYIDGDHSYEGCFLDLIYSDKLSKAGSVIAMDDYSLTGWWQDGVTRAVNCFLGINSSRYIFLGRSKSQVYLQKILD